MNGITVSPTSRDSAECEPIVLRETTTTRLIFQPLLVNNIHDSSASINGTFIFQRRAPGKEWVEEKTLDLSKLKAQEWVKLFLHPSELQKLVQELNALYELHLQEGIPRRPTRFVRTEAQIAALLTSDEGVLLSTLAKNKESGLDLAARLIRWAAEVENTEDVVAKLESLGPDTLQKLNTLVGIGQLKNVLTIWKANSGNTNEEYWQQLLTKYSFVLSQVFAYPVVIVKEKAYLGGKGVENTGGNLVDFLLKNELTENAVLVEIKTPATGIVGGLYRDDIYNMSEALMGAVMQASNYKHRLQQQYNNLIQDSTSNYYSFNPQCLVIAGNLKRQRLNKDQRKSFELFRTSQKDVQVITFDELFGKVKTLVDLLEGNDTLPF